MSEKRINKKNGARTASGAGPVSNSGPMDVALLEKLVKLMAENGLSAVELSDGDQRIMLKRGGDAVAMASPNYSFAPPSAASQAAPPAHAPKSGDAAADDDSKLIPVKSPMPGTFYASPAKGAKPFVLVGGRVEEDTDVCIVEAMKVFNTIKAEARGVIAKILVQDSQPVEFGQVLFLVKPG